MTRTAEASRIPDASTTEAEPAHSVRSRPSSFPVILIRLESRASRLVAVALILAGALWLTKVIASPAIADWLPKRSIADLERALAWDPSNPAPHLRLGQAHQTDLEGADLGKARFHLAMALRLRPSDSFVWLQLALLADRQGDRAGARRALDTALRYDQHNVVLRWEATLLMLRWEERQQALEHLRYVIAVDPERREAALRLGLALLPFGQSLMSLLPEEPEPLTGLFRTALLQRDTALARTVWQRRALLAPALPVEWQRAYLELLLDQGEGTAARPVWLALATNGHPQPGNAVWNGGFEADRLLGWGFDWRIRRIWGVEVTLDRFVAAEGRQSLRLSFNRLPTLDFFHVFQYVPVEPGHEYRVRALVRALDFATASGLKLQVATPDGETVLAETRTISGTTTDWVPLETRVRISAGLTLVRFQLRREPAPDAEANLSGRLWLDEVSLTPVRGRIPSGPTGGQG